ncbi:MAG: hypothetical protein HFJ35_07460 [Clostridia bacterium]|nr:hypothetical protein [Clostridia bacterium]
MDNRIKFEELIKYIEMHLTEKIDYNKLSKILAVSEQSMQRIFVLLLICLYQNILEKED